MYWVEVGGYYLPQKVGGHPALEFCNTRANWGRPAGPRDDWLYEYPVLAAWARHVDLLDGNTVAGLRALAGRRPAEAEAVLDEARELRAASYAVLVDPAADPTAFATVARYCERAAGAARLEFDPYGLASWRLPAELGLRLPVLAAARSIADLLADPRRRTVHACPGHDCGWLFLDPRGRRRWCSMATCGNRAKVRAHAQRNR